MDNKVQELKEVLTPIGLGAILIFYIFSFSTFAFSREGNTENLSGKVIAEKYLVGGTLLKHGSYMLMRINKRQLIFGPKHIKYVMDGATVNVIVSTSIPPEWDREVAEHYPNALFVVDLLYSKIQIKNINGEKNTVSLYPES